MQSASEPESQVRGLDVARSYIVFTLVVQLLWLLHMTTRDLVGLETVGGTYGVAIPGLVAVLCGPLGWALLAVLAALGVDAVRKLRVAPAYALASAPSHDECATWLRHKYDLLARESAYQPHEPSEGSILDCRQRLHREELACGLAAKSTEDLFECAEGSGHSKVL